jgi:sugar phosphate isomerase/epimerase
MFRFGVEGRQLRAESSGSADPRGDGAGAGWWRYRLPGLGAVDWNVFITSLADAGYDGPLSIEHEDPLWEGDLATVQRGLRVARDHLSQFVPGRTASGGST